MALSDIDNIDALDSIDYVNASDETLAKEFLAVLFHHTNDPRSIELFYGQMKAEGFEDVNSGDIRIVIESPTVRVRFYQTGANKTRCHLYLYVDSEWVLTSEIVQDGIFSAAGA
jgi:hypothetical protein